MFPSHLLFSVEGEDETTSGIHGQIDQNVQNFRHILPKDEVIGDRLRHVARHDAIGLVKGAAPLRPAMD